MVGSGAVTRSAMNCWRRFHSDETVIADPFHSTDELIELLQESSGGFLRSSIRPLPICRSVSG
jgi:hypothetical protein